MWRVFNVEGNGEPTLNADAMDALTDVMRGVLNESEQKNTELREYYKPLRETLRGTTLEVRRDSAEFAELMNAYGDGKNGRQWGNVRKALFGRLNVRLTDGAGNWDTMQAELAESWPGTFDAENTDITAFTDAVLGVYEAKPTPSGLTRNIHQCLHDYDIPLHLSHTVTRVMGQDRLTAVEVSQVDERMRPIAGTEEIIACDALILSVGLIPENELAEGLGVLLDPRTKGPKCNAQLMTSVDGVFSCGNALHVNDLVDYVSESGETAGENAAKYSRQKRQEIPIAAGSNLLYAVPQMLDLAGDNSSTTVYFRSREDLNGCRFVITVDGREVFSRRYPFLRPPEMEKLVIDFSSYGLTTQSQVKLDIEVKADA